MMKHTSTILLVFLGALCLRTSAFARMSKPFLCMRKVQLHATLSHDATAGDDSLFDEEEAAAIDAHDISDPGMEAAAMERAVMLAAEYKEEQMKKNALKDNSINMSKPCIGGAALVKALDDQYKDVSTEDIVSDEESLLDDEEAAAIDAHDISDPGLEAAAMERAVMLAAEYKKEQMKKNQMKQKQKQEDHIKAVEEHYKEVEKDISAIEHLIQEAAYADHAPGHSLDSTFSQTDAADLALLMMEKSVSAAKDKLELCREKAKLAEENVRTALEQKYTAKALAESIERERHAAEMRFFSHKYDDEPPNLMELGDGSFADNEMLLHEAHKQEHDAEMLLEEAIEDDIAAKKDLEQMIENKATLKAELHDLQEIIHEHAVWAMEKKVEKK